MCILMLVLPIIFGGSNIVPASTETETDDSINKQSSWLRAIEFTVEAVVPEADKNVEAAGDNGGG
jgi:hypothetical protein